MECGYYTQISPVIKDSLKSVIFTQRQVTMHWFQDTIFMVIFIFPSVLFVLGGILGWLSRRYWVGGAAAFVFAMAFMLLEANETFLIWVIFYTVVGLAGSGLGWAARKLTGRSAA